MQMTATVVVSIYKEVPDLSVLSMIPMTTTIGADVTMTVTMITIPVVILLDNDHCPGLRHRLVLKQSHINNEHNRYHYENTNGSNNIHFLL